MMGKPIDLIIVLICIKLPEELSELIFYNYI